MSRPSRCERMIETPIVLGLEGEAGMTPEEIEGIIAAFGPFNECEE